MSSAGDTVVLVLAIVVPLLLFLGVFFVLLLYFLSRTARKVRAEVEAELSNIELIDQGASFFGLSSKGVGQVRGNGCLALTEHELVFRMWVPKQWLRIRREDITAVETPRSHLGKTRGTPLLLVAFKDHERSAVDTIAWQVRDLAAWTRALEP